VRGRVSSGLVPDGQMVEMVRDGQGDEWNIWGVAPLCPEADGGAQWRWDW
jgi:hypothetical protein